VPLQKTSRTKTMASVVSRALLRAGAVRAHDNGGCHCCCCCCCCCLHDRPWPVSDGESGAVRGAVPCGAIVPYRAVDAAQRDVHPLASGLTDTIDNH